MPPSFDTRRARLALVLSSLLALGACGSGSSDSPAPEPPAPAVPDPMAGYQWYLNNTGQDVLAGVRPVAGIDLNLGTLFGDGIRGKGVVVAVVDDGLDVDHEDLAANADAAGSIDLWHCPDRANLDSCPSGPTLNPSFPNDYHGTGVGGLIGMAAMNGKGGRGIAPEVRLKAFNLIGSHSGGRPSKTDALHYNLFALGENNRRAVDVDIFNMSYGGEDVSMPEDDEDDFTDGIERLLASTRGGKGGLYVKAAGNEFLRSAAYPGADCSQAHAHQVGCFDAATDAEASLMGIVLASAVNAAGKRSSYSSEGAPVWVAGFGGEFNIAPAYMPGASNVLLEPALFSTDRSGCQFGVNRVGQPPRNAIDNGGASTIDPACRYTASFNGTSSAAPTVSSVTALVLQARPELKARDVHYVLAKSARHPGNWLRDGVLHQPPRQTADGRVFDPGWHVNDKGVRFSRWFGYGLVDAHAAVAMAKTFTPLPAAVSIEAETPDDASAAIRHAKDKAVGARESSLALTLDKDITIERVQIAFDSTHTAPSRLLVTLQSPSGTRIPALLPYTSLEDTEEGFGTTLLGVNGFLDESARGEWRLYIEDMGLPLGSDSHLPPADLPQLTAFAIRVLGHVPAAR